MGIINLFTSCLREAKKQKKCDFESIAKIVAVTFCVISVLFGVSFFAIQLIIVAMCLQERQKDEAGKCFDSVFYFSCVLIILNVVIWSSVSRCCCNCFCHGCCYRWRNYKCRKALKCLQEHPFTKNLPLDEENTVVKHLETLMKDTWMYNDHLGADATSLEKIQHQSVKIRHIFQIENAEHAVRYLTRHLETFESYQLPDHLRNNPIKTKTVPTHRNRALSQLSLTLMDVFNDPVTESRDEGEVECEESSVAQVHITRDNPHVRKATLHIDIEEEHIAERDKTAFMFDLRRRVSAIPSISKYKRCAITPQNRRASTGTETANTVSSYLKRYDELPCRVGKVNSSTPVGSTPGSPVSPSNNVAFTFGDEDIFCQDSVLIEISPAQETDNSDANIRSETNLCGITTPTPEVPQTTSVSGTSQRSNGDAAARKHKKRRKKKKSSRNIEALQIKSGITNAGEAFLFHGTRLRNVVSIIENGFDLSHSKSGLFGKGIYLAESSQKADQYADSPTNRRKNFLTMFVVRTSLGKIGLYDPKSDVNDSLHSGHDSVVVDDTVVAGQNKRFREFIKQDVTQCYPEFLIIYDRV